ncbi:MAG TPA: DNA repair protein RadC [Lachnospiraceae bacterium]|nr:DNA repair protein RadC [Lachnospiraceae bacterium]
MTGTVVTTGMADEGEHTRIPIVSLQVVADRYVEYLREDLATSRKAAEWVERNIIRHSNREHLVVVCCDADNRATNIDVVAKGTAEYCPASVVEIFKVAVISNALKIILFHNHPSGNPSPSREDEETTKRVRKAGELLEIELVDHIIIGSNGTYYSFMENNKLDVGKSDGT